MKDGFVNVLKPPGMTSHDVVRLVRRTLDVKKVGHAGTLDPGAAGVLPVAIGRAVRLLEYLNAVDKSYRAELRFGEETDSGDDLGEVIAAREDFIMPDEASLEAARQELTGRIWQVPPAYSAVKIGGRRACDLARAHLPVTVPAREVEIYRLEIVTKRADTLLFDVDCSKGTYIRSLCTDIGASLRLPATMRFLLRTCVGGFVLADAYTLEELAEVGERAVCTPDTALDLLCYELDPQRVKAFYSGLSTSERRLPLAEGFYRVYAEGVFLGIGRYDVAAQEMYPAKAFPPV